MADISKINAVLIANIAEIDDVLAANIAKVNGLVFSTAPAFTGLLDTYTGAAAAYSTRRLYSLYTGAALRVREDATDTETDIGFDSNGDLDTAAIATHCGTANGYVTKWYGQESSGGTGSGNDAAQATSGSQPQIYNGTAVITENGKPALSFSSDTFDFTITGNANNFSAFTVTTNDATTGNHMQMLTSVNPRWWHWYYSGNKSFYYNNTSINHSAIDTSQHLSAMIAGSTLGHAGFWIDNVKASTTASLITNSFDGQEKIGDYVTGGNPWDGTMQEIVLWQSDQSTNRSGIEGNQNAHFQIGNFGTPTSGLLYDYSGAAAAYSVRQLANTAALAMRIREDGTDTELDIGFDSNGDLDTAAIASHCSTNNGFVVTWYDQAGSQVDATQGTSGSQPQIYNGTAVITENGKPAVDFRHPMNLTFTNTALITAFVACRSDTVNATSTNRVLGGTTSTRYPLGSNRTFGGTFSASIGTSTSLTFGSATDTTQKLIYANNQSGTQYLSVDGATPTSATITAGNVDMLGSDRVLSYFTHNGTVQEVLLWTTDESSNRTGIETNINNYFSIY